MQWRWGSPACCLTGLNALSNQCHTWVNEGCAPGSIRLRGPGMVTTSPLLELLLRIILRTLCVTLPRLVCLHASYLDSYSTVLSDTPKAEEFSQCRDAPFVSSPYLCACCTCSRVLGLNPAAACAGP